MGMQKAHELWLFCYGETSMGICFVEMWQMADAEMALLLYQGPIQQNKKGGQQNKL